MTIEKVDKWLKEQYGVSYTELNKYFFTIYRQNKKKMREIKHLNDQLDQALKELDVWQQSK